MTYRPYVFCGIWGMVWRKKGREVSIVSPLSQECVLAKKSRVQIELIPDMYEIGLFRKVLSSRKRLRVTAICCVAGLAAAFGGVGYFLRYVSQWDVVNVLLIVALFIATLAVAYIVALALGDVFFAGPWREKMAHGGKYIPERIEDQAALLKNKTIYFLLIWVFSIAVLGLGCDFGTGGNIHWYQKTGGIVMSMRSPDPAERLAVLKTVANAYHSSKWEDPEICDHIVRLILDPDSSDVRGWAAYIAGRAVLVDAADNLVALLRDESASAQARAEAAIAIGRIEWKSARSALFSILQSRFTADHGDTELVPAILFSLYSMHDPVAAQYVIGMMDACLADRNCSSEVLQYGFFYLKSLRVKDAAALSFRYLAADGITPEMRCYAADILRWTASRQDVPAMKREFDKAPRDVECPVLFRKYHEEPGIILYERYTLRALFLKSVGNIKDPADFDWIWMVGSNPEEDMQTRKAAEMETRARQATEAK